MKRPILKAVAPIGAVLLFASAALVAAAQPAPPGIPVATGLDQPRGLSLDGDDVLIAELGAGQIVRLSPDGTTTVEVSGLATGSFFNESAGAEEGAGPSSVRAVAGGFIVTVSEGPDDRFQSVYFVDEAGGEPMLVASLGAYEQANNTDGALNPAGEDDLLSNPYDAVEYDGALLVSDSGANTVLRIGEAGTLAPFAIFEALPNPMFPGLGGPTRQQVPTGMTIGPDGAVYVGTLTGFPFVTGGATVYRLEDLNGDGDALDDGEMTAFATGLTTVTDVAFDADGSLLVTEFSTDMLTQAPGRLVRVEGTSTEVVAGGLISPTGLVVTNDGRILVSQEFTGLVTDVTNAGAGATPPPAGGTPPPASAPAPAETGQLGTDTGADMGLVVLALLGTALLLGGSRRLTEVRGR